MVVMSSSLCRQDFWGGFMGSSSGLADVWLGALDRFLDSLVCSQDQPSGGFGPRKGACSVARVVLFLPKSIGSMLAPVMGCGQWGLFDRGRCS